MLQKALHQINLCKCYLANCQALANCPTNDYAHDYAGLKAIPRIIFQTKNYCDKIRYFLNAHDTKCIPDSYFRFTDFLHHRANRLDINAMLEKMSDHCNCLHEDVRKVFPVIVVKADDEHSSKPNSDPEAIDKVVVGILGNEPKKN